MGGGRFIVNPVSDMEYIKITLLLDAATMDFYGKMAAEVGVPVGEFVSDMLVGHFEICSFLGSTRPAIDLSLN